MKNYSKLSQDEKYDLINKLYSSENKSFYDIAEILGTYPNKIRRDAKSLNIPIRTKSEAQKNALQTGKHKHPTKGRERSEEEKNKIGNSVMESWESMSDKQLQKRKKIAQKNWEKLSNDEKEYMQRSATAAVRHASKVGTKLEKFLLNRLLQNGYSVDFHKEQTLVNTKLQIDIFLPKLNIAIEVDGPSHFEPVWGDESLKRNITYDQKKEGLIIGKGWHLIRLKQTKDFSQARARKCYEKLDQAIKVLIDTKPNSSKLITIED